MGRTVNASTIARLNAQITAVGYLLLMRAPSVLNPAAAPSTIQLCDIKTFANSGGTWTANDFDVKGVGTDNVTVSVQNLDGAIGAFVLNADGLGDVEFTLWQFETGDADNPVFLGSFSAANAAVGIDRVTLTLKETNLQYRFAPLRRVSARDGFKYALRPGEILLWGAHRVIIQKGN